MIAKFISPTSLGNDMGIYEFSKTVELKKGGCGTIRIFAATRYILYINDSYVCEGPCRCASDIRYFDEVESDLFVAGTNNIRVVVMHVADRNIFSSAMKSAYPMLIFQADVGGQVINSDSEWQCGYISTTKLVRANNRGGNSVADFVPPFEDVQYPVQKNELDVTESGYFDFEYKECNIYGIDTPYYLVKRPIPMIYPQKPIILTVAKQGDGFVELDAGEYTTAKLEFDFAGSVDAKITYAECYQFGNEKRRRDDTNGELVGPYDYITTNTDVTYSPYWFRAFRYIRIETTDPIAVRQVRAYRVNYPFDITGSFECSNYSYNKMWDVSINTLKCCTHEIFVDCPHYEQQQYVMDSAIECAVTMRLTDDTCMVRKCISEFAASQQPSGLLCANYPCSYVQIIPGFSFYFVFLLKDYLEYSADVEFASQYTGVIDKILSFFDNQVREKGYITNSRFWDYQDWVDGWYNGKSPVPDGEAIAIYNLYYACALKEAAYIFNKVGRELTADEYMRRYEKLKNTINDLCYNKEKGMYRDGSNCETYCVHTAVWAILADVVPEGEMPRVAKCISDMSISRASFSMNYYLLRAMEKCGMYAYASQLLNGWQVMLDNHCTTWCENPGDSRSECHAWSCAPVHEFSSHILGVKYDFSDVINIQPELLGLSYAKGSVPTRFGLVNIDWKISDGSFVLDISAPDGVTKKVTMPDGTTHSFEYTTAHLECVVE